MQRGRWLGLAFLVLMAGYGGWRGPSLLSDTVMWVLASLPVLFTLTLAGWELRRQAPSTVGIMLLPTLVAALFVTACGVGIAWLSAEQTKRWDEPVLRMAVGAGVTLLVGTAVALTRRTTVPMKHDGTANGPSEEES